MTYKTGHARLAPIIGLLLAACAMDNPAFGGRSSVADAETGTDGTGYPDSDTDESGSQEGSGASSDSDPNPGDGDGDPATSDTASSGDTDPPGDGDGDPDTSDTDTTGNTDPDPGTGDGDGDLPGDGDGDLPGDGDGDLPLCEELDEFSCGDAPGCLPLYIEEFEIFGNDEGACSAGVFFYECIYEQDCVANMEFFCSFDLWVRAIECMPVSLIEDYGLEPCPPPPGPIMECI